MASMHTITHGAGKAAGVGPGAGSQGPEARNLDAKVEVEIEPEIEPGGAGRAGRCTQMVSIALPYGSDNQAIQL